MDINKKLKIKVPHEKYKNVIYTRNRKSPIKWSLNSEKREEKRRDTKSKMKSEMEREVFQNFTLPFYKTEIYDK